MCDRYCVGYTPCDIRKYSAKGLLHSIDDTSQPLILINSVVYMCREAHIQLSFETLDWGLDAVLVMQLLLCEKNANFHQR